MSLFCSGCGVRISDTSKGCCGSMLRRELDVKVADSKTISNGCDMHIINSYPVKYVNTVIDVDPDKAIDKALKRKT